MQRWIAAAVLAMMLIGAGGVFGLWMHRQNRPAPMWVELPVNPDRSEEDCQRTAKELLVKLRENDRLAKVSNDLGLPEKWQMASDSEAARELSNRLFVKIGETGPEMARVRAVQIGVQGKLKERELSGKIAMRLMEDVWKIVGIKRPQNQ